jgi:hypothetical protein
MKNIAIGFGVGVLLALAIFFFYIVPQGKKIEEKISAAYSKGLAECVAQTDTIIIPGKPIIEYRDTSFHSTPKPAKHEVVKDKLEIVDSDRAEWISGKDEININTTVKTTVELFDGKYRPASEILTEFFYDIDHKDFEVQADTVKIQVPKFIKEVQLETNWMLITLAYVGGAITAILIWLVGG